MISNQKTDSPFYIDPLTYGKEKFRFIDLFAGIGGMRIGFEKQGGKCVFSSEMDKFSRTTYSANFGTTPYGDITQIHETTVPDHEILLAGFPCQPFSLAGVSKKNSLGRPTGFLDKTQGTLFFDIVRILNHKRPKLFLLENVKNLKSHDGGRTWAIILSTLEELNYKVFPAVLNGKAYVPQNRERIFLVGFDRKCFGDDVLFEYTLSKPEKQPVLKDILEPAVDSKYTLSDKLWTYLQKYSAKHRALGNGFGYGIGNPDGVSRTLSARYGKDGSEILIKQKNKNPRRLTPRECARLQGFNDDFQIVVSDAQAYRQFGNSVVVPLIEVIAKKMVQHLI